MNSEPANRSQGELIYDESLQPESYEFRFSAAYGFRYSVKASKDRRSVNFAGPESVRTKEIATG